MQSKFVINYYGKENKIFYSLLFVLCLKKPNNYFGCEICYEKMCNLEQYIPHLLIIFSCNYLMSCYVSLF
jgi:hypothetical protein